MGDPKKLKKKYFTPMHPWIRSSIEEEKVLKQDYGLKNKKEIFIAKSFLKKYKSLAKKLIASRTSQSKKEETQIIQKLQRLGLLSVGTNLNDILNLEIKNILDRRLQSLVFRHNLSRSMNQARQFIVHRHISIKGTEITSPSYIVSLEEESLLAFKEKSSLANPEHPERVVISAAPEESAKESNSKEKESQEEGVILELSEEDKLLDVMEEA